MTIASVRDALVEISSAPYNRFIKLILCIRNHDWDNMITVLQPLHYSDLWGVECDAEMSMSDCCVVTSKLRD